MVDLGALAAVLDHQIVDDANLLAVAELSAQVKGHILLLLVAVVASLIGAAVGILFLQDHRWFPACLSLAALACRTLHGGALATFCN